MAKLDDKEGGQLPATVSYRYLTCPEKSRCTPQELTYCHDMMSEVQFVMSSLSSTIIRNDSSPFMLDKLVGVQSQKLILLPPSTRCCSTGGAVNQNCRKTRSESIRSNAQFTFFRSQSHFSSDCRRTGARKRQEVWFYFIFLNSIINYLSFVDIHNFSIRDMCILGKSNGLRRIAYFNRNK